MQIHTQVHIHINKVLKTQNLQYSLLKLENLRKEHRPRKYSPSDNPIKKAAIPRVQTMVVIVRPSAILAFCLAAGQLAVSLQFLLCVNDRVYTANLQHALASNSLFQLTAKQLVVRYCSSVYHTMLMISYDRRLNIIFAK